MKKKGEKVNFTDRSLGLFSVYGFAPLLSILKSETDSIRLLKDDLYSIFTMGCYLATEGSTVDRYRKDNKMDKKKHSMRIRWVLCLFAIGIGMVFFMAASGQLNVKTKEMERSMILASASKQDTKAVPPIDAAALAVVATASFGLG